MEHPRLLPGSMEEIPEDLRCKRSDGKQWRCSALSMPDKTVCEKHYIQAKKRVANSALRASMKKARRGTSDDADIYLETKHNGHEVSRSLSPMNVGGLEYKKHKEKFGRSQGLYTPETMGSKGSSIHGGNSLRFNDEGPKEDKNRVRSAYNSSYLSKEVKNPSGGGYGDYYGKSSESGEAEGLTCHQCRRSYRGSVVWCMSCDRKGYCGNCISQWYADIPVEDIRKICPACQGICNCKVCLRGDNLIKTMVQEIASLDKLQYLHSLLSFILPALKQIYSEQCFEIAVETRVHGMKTDIPRVTVRADEQMCCNLCRIPIFDFHLHCTHCSYDLCLTCCRDIRKPSLAALKGESTGEKNLADKLILQSTDENAIDFSHLFSKWKANSDGSIPCPPDEVGGCGSSKLVLGRILSINWVAKLVKNAEEIVSGCKVTDLQGGSSESKLCQCSNRDGSNDNFLYYPMSEDLKHEGIRHFHKHWVKGEPVIVKSVFDHSLASSWDPMSIWRGIQETADERLQENNAIVKVTDLLKQSEVDIELTQFIKGYSEGLKHEDGWPKMLVLKDWPPPSAWEEFILCQRPEFLTNLPLVEFIHSKWGLLNLAAKLPHDSTQNEAGPKIYFSYGTHDELGRGDPVRKLRINMGDVVYLLMHSAEANTQVSKVSKVENNDRNSKESDGTEITSVLKRSFHAGAIWDVFRRQDVPKRLNLNGYTKGARNEIFAMQPAPIQVSYMGFPGTTGASYIDYLVTDEFVSPTRFSHIYSEKLVHLPHCYFVNDYKQKNRDVLDPVSRHKRSDYGLPEDKFIFACFNQLYKMDPDIFNTWCNILKHVPNSALWLLRFPAAGERRLHEYARRQGVREDQIIFTDVAMKNEHIRRGALADLFLDTPLCNAHTTGTDVLWAGLPMITLPLEKMATRVAGSLCLATGVGEEMIVSSMKEYEEKAVALALNPSKLHALRNKLKAARLTCPLFDTARWVRNLERAYFKMWNLYCSGGHPQPFKVTENDNEFPYDR